MNTKKIKFIIFNLPLTAMFFKSAKILPIIIFVFLFFCFFINTSSAAGLWDNISCKEKGDCTLNDFVQIGVNVTNVILGVVGSLALLFFVYGGLMMIISSGKSESVQKAKTILTNAVIGLVIVFTSWIIINFTVSVLTGSNTIFGRPWYSTPSK
jgi:hypothetical protein